MLQRGKLRLDRDGDVALDLFGRQAGTLRDHIHHRRRGIGIGLDIEFAERDDAADENDHEQRHHQDSMPERKGDDPVHGVVFAAASAPDATRSMNRLPLVTTRSPGPSPLSTSTILPLVSPTLIRLSSIAFSSFFSRTAQTRAMSPSEMLASHENPTALSLSPERIFTLANIAGLSSPSALSTVARTKSRRVVVSKQKTTYEILAGNWRSG